MASPACKRPATGYWPFVLWYNTEHRLRVLRFVTPQQRHDGYGSDILEKRRAL